MAHYLFAYFNNNTAEGQQVCYAVSDDGVNFIPLNDGRPVIASDSISRSGGVRDYELVHETKTEGKFTPRHGGIIQITDMEYQLLQKTYGRHKNLR